MIRTFSVRALLSLWALLTAYLIAVSSINAASAPKSVIAAETFYPQSGRLIAKSALQLIVDDPTPQGRARALELVKQAVSINAYAIDAYVTLASLQVLGTAPGDVAWTFSFAHRLSRRDPRVELWLVGDNLRQEQIRPALYHAAHAIQGSQSAKALLMTAFSQAVVDREFVEPLADMMVKTPRLANDVAVALVYSGKDIVNVALTLESAISRGAAIDPALVAEAAQRAVAQGFYDHAARLMRRPGKLLVVNGQFRAQPRYGPFDWSFRNDGGLSAFQMAISDGKQEVSALGLSVASESIGELAWQTLLLTPGRYNLQLALAGDSQRAAERIMLRLECLNKLEVTLGLMDPIRSGSTVIAVPKLGCRAQRLVFLAGGARSLRPEQVIIQSVTIEHSHLPLQSHRTETQGAY